VVQSLSLKAWVQAVENADSPRSPEVRPCSHQHQHATVKLEDSLHPREWSYIAPCVLLYSPASIDIDEPDLGVGCGSWVLLYSAVGGAVE
jgi:hypothetical protein